MAQATFVFPSPWGMESSTLLTITDQGLQRLPALYDWWKVVKVDTDGKSIPILPLGTPYLKHVDTIDKMRALVYWADERDEVSGALPGERWLASQFTKWEISNIANAMCVADGVNLDLATFAYTRYDIAREYDNLGKYACIGLVVILLIHFWSVYFS